MYLNINILEKISISNRGNGCVGKVFKLINYRIKFNANEREMYFRYNIFNTQVNKVNTHVNTPKKGNTKNVEAGE